MKLKPEIEKLIKEETRKNLLEATKVSQTEFETTMPAGAVSVSMPLTDDQLVSKPQAQLHWYIDMAKENWGFSKMQMAIRNLIVLYNVEDISTQKKMPHHHKVISDFVPDKGWELHVDYISDKSELRPYLVDMDYQKKLISVTFTSF